jgi:hypothetical protein
MQNLIFAHSRGKVVQNIVDRDSHAANTRLAAALSRLNRNVLRVVHNRKLRALRLPVKQAVSTPGAKAVRWPGPLGSG